VKSTTVETDRKTALTPADLCVPTLAEAPLSRRGWIFELKYDGFRILATKHGSSVALLSRRGTDFTDRFPEIATELAMLPDVVLDGELVSLDDGGRPQFEKLVRRSRLKRKISIDHGARTEPAALFVFDILELCGRDVRKMALLDRKQTLGEAIGTGSRIRSVGYVPSMGIELFNAADDAGLEGIVAKREDSPYRRGRSSDWIKIKTAHGRAIDEDRARWNER